MTLALLIIFSFLYILGIILVTTLDDVLSAVTLANTKTDSLIAFTSGLEKQLDDALSGATLPAGVQAKVDAIFTAVQDEVTKVDAALVANTPAP